MTLKTKIARWFLICLVAIPAVIAAVGVAMFVGIVLLASRFSPKLARLVAIAKKRSDLDRPRRTRSEKAA